MATERASQPLWIAVLGNPRSLNVSGGWAEAGVFRMGRSPQFYDPQCPEIEEKTLDSPVQVPVAPWSGGLFCAGLQSCQ